MTDDAESGSAEGTTRAASRRGARRRRSTGAFIRDVVVILLVAILVSFLIKTFLVRSFYIPSGSMENTLRVNDRILVNELEPRFLPIHHGDVVVFRDPGGWLNESVVQPPSNPVVRVVDGVLSLVGLSASDSDDHLIKRVIGLPGDHVACCNPLGQITVNGVPLREPYTTVPAGRDASTVPFDVVVPANSLWVMGDNRYNSQDSSRNQNLPGKGFVPESDVVGRAFVITWPVSHWAWLDDYSSVFRGVEDGSRR